MGQPVRIIDLAQEMIRQAGLTVGTDIEIEFTGIRPGEKLYEELAGDSEQTRPTAHAGIRVWQHPAATAGQVQRMLETLDAVVDADREQVVRALRHIVPEYRAADAGSESPPDQASPLRLLAAQAA
jgi:O-antigen biosynthesis protein WbqV